MVCVIPAAVQSRRLGASWQMTRPAEGASQRLKMKEEERNLKDSGIINEKIRGQRRTKKKPRWKKAEIMIKLNEEERK